MTDFQRFISARIGKVPVSGFFPNLIFPKKNLTRSSPEQKSLLSKEIVERLIKQWSKTSRLSG